MDKQPYEVTEDDFNAAVENAGYWAKRRLFKKMGKRVWKNKNVHFGSPRPPKDLETWVTHWVLTNRDKAA